MSRLTKYEGKRFSCNIIYCPKDCNTCEMHKAIRDKLAHYEDLEEKGRLIELPCEKVYRIINYDSPNYAFIDSIPIVMMPIYEFKHIDNGNIFFSTKEKAEAKLEEVKGK